MARRLFGTALAFGAMAFISPTSALSQIRWQSGPAHLTSATSGPILSKIRTLVPGSGTRHVLVHFEGPVDRPLRSKLSAEGLTLQDYVGDHTYFAALSAMRADAPRLASHQKLKDVLAIDPRWKIHSGLTPDQVPEWAIVSYAGQTVVHESHEKVEANSGLVVAAYVKLHQDVPLATDGEQVCRKHGAKIRSQLKTINGFVIELPLANVAALAAEDAVEWIEPPLPKMSTDNIENRARVGADIAQTPSYGLSGASVTVMVYDAGTARASHLDFGGRLTVRDGSPLYDHSTHVAGTIGGSGAASGGANRGMAPEVQLESYGFQQPGGSSPGFLYTDPGDLEADYDDAIHSHGVNLANNSIGTNVAVNNFPCSWEGNYGLTSAVIDSIARGSLGVPLPIIWAAGNERKFPSRCGAEYGTIAPPAGSKNAICVGAVYSNDDTMTAFSGWGPTDDGRLKPDLCAPGCQIGGDNGVTSSSAASDTAYSVLCGTSMAAPTVTGVSALLLEDYHARYPDRPDFRNATLKAILTQTAVDLGNPGPDFQFGYGSVRAVPAIELLRSGAFVEGQIDLGETYQATVQVNPGETTLKVTLAWDDVPAAPNVIVNLVNDLELRVYDPNGGVHYPWTLNPANPTAPAVRTQADHLNNVEQVVVDVPSPGTYRIEVSCFNLPQGPQAFSICASPRLAACASKGGVVFGRASYVCQDSATVQVVDCDLNSDDQAIETVSVHVASSSDPFGRFFDLTETAPDSATFVGSVYLTEETDPVWNIEGEWAFSEAGS